MTTICPTWLQAFDRALVRLYAIDHTDAGMSDVELARYADLAPVEAALQCGEDHDLDRVDGPWGQ